MPDANMRQQLLDLASRLQASLRAAPAKGPQAFTSAERQYVLDTIRLLHERAAAAGDAARGIFLCRGASTGRPTAGARCRRRPCGSRSDTAAS